MHARLWKFLFNLFPAFRGTGAKITFIADDWGQVHVKVPLSWRTRNYVGTIFGGSMYAAVDPFYMIMLIKKLGSDYVVWDKSASIRFKKPGRSTLFAHFTIGDDTVAEIRNTLMSTPKIDRIFLVELRDANGVVHAEVEKTIHIRMVKENDQ